MQRGILGFRTVSFGGSSAKIAVWKSLELLKEAFGARYQRLFISVRWTVFVGDLGLDLTSVVLRFGNVLNSLFDSINTLHPIAIAFI